MKIILWLAIATGASVAHAQTIQCSDPRLNVYFETEEEAYAGCPKANNVYVTYDWGYGMYTCGCTNPDNGGGGN